MEPGRERSAERTDSEKACIHGGVHTCAGGCQRAARPRDRRLGRGTAHLPGRPAGESGPCAHGFIEGNDGRRRCDDAGKERGDAEHRTAGHRGNRTRRSCGGWRRHRGLRRQRARSWRGSTGPGRTRRRRTSTRIQVDPVLGLVAKCVRPSFIFAIFASGDKTLVALDEIGVRSHVSEPERGRRRWQDKKTGRRRLGSVLRRSGNVASWWSGLSRAVMRISASACSSRRPAATSGRYCAA